MEKKGSIVIHLHDGFKGIFNPDVRDNFNEPFIYLKDRLDEIGYTLIAENDELPTDCQWIFFINVPRSLNKDSFRQKIKLFLKKILNKTKPENKNYDLYNAGIKKGLKDRMVLFLWEGKSVYPQNYNSENYKKFKYIFTWDDTLVDNVKFFKFYLPVPSQFPNITATPFEKKRLLVNISRNRFSKVRNELYTARRESIKYFEKNYSNDFDLFGYDWKKPSTYWQKLFPILKDKYPSYRGTVKNKWEVLPNYKFCLCYENLAGEKGQITEKIFDCLRSKTVPIYWGAENISNYIPPAVFIDRKSFRSNRYLAEFILKMNKDEYNRFIIAGEEYLNTEKFKLFLPKNFSETIINILNL